MKKTVHFFERQNLPLRFGVLFFRVIDLFFLILCQNEGLPRVILENHFETAPAICAGAPQIALMAEEKSPSQISLRPVANAPE